MTEPSALHYTEEHEWIDVDGDIATVGITDYAAEKLGDVVYVDLPAAGTTVTEGTVVGEIVEANQAVVDSPELVNSDPFGEGWLLKVRTSSLPKLLTHDEYRALVGE